MDNKPNLAFRISRDFSNLYCELHHMGLSSKNAKDGTVVKVCCSFFKDEVEQALQQKLGEGFVNEHIKFALPFTAAPGLSGSGAMPDE